MYFDFEKFADKFPIKMVHMRSHLILDNLFIDLAIELSIFKMILDILFTNQIVK